MSVITTIKQVVNNTLDNLKGLVAINDEREEKAAQDSQDAKLMAAYDSEFEDSANKKTSYEKIWFTNIAFLLGQHWMQWNDFTKKFEEPRMPDWRVQLTCNKILPRYRKALNHLSTFDPVAVVTPNSNETLDIEAAQLGTKLLKGLKDKIHIVKKQHRLNQWRLTCGSVFLHWLWNPYLGSEIPNKEQPRINGDNEELANDMSVFDGENKPKGESNELFTGDIDVEVWNAFEVYPLDNPASMDECRKLIHAKYVAIDDVKTIYPETARELKEETDETTAGMYLRKIESLMGTQSEGLSSQVKNEGKVLLKRVWEKPSERHPKGFFMAYANGVLLEKQDSLPNIELGKEFEMPILKYDDLDVPGRFWGQSTIEQMLPVNKELNRSISQIIESRNLMSKPKWSAPKGAVNKNSITSEPGEIIESNTGVPNFFEPHPVTPPSLPQYVVILPNILDGVLADIGAWHEPSRGEAPAGITSGIALQELKKSDEDEMNPLFVQDTENKKILYGGLLKLVQDKYTEQRLIKVVGNDRITEVINFIGADLRNNTDVWIETTDLVPNSRRGRQEMVMEFFKDGLLGDQQNDETRKRAIRLLEWGNIDDIWEEGSLDAKQARYENKELAKGNPQEVKWYDVHDTHMLEHLKITKSPLFKKQPPNIQAVAEDHIKKHDDFSSGMHPENPEANLNVQPPQNLLPAPSVQRGV